MRIGFDMLAVQSPGSRGRGIGRYVSHLTASVLANHPGHDYFLYLHEQLPADLMPAAPSAKLREIRVDAKRGESSLAQAVDRLVQVNPDELDVLVVTSPFEAVYGYQSPAKPAKGLKLAAVVYDTIPFVFFPAENIDAAPRQLYRSLDNLRRYDMLLAISESTRRDFLSLLGLPADRVVTISTASDGRFFLPDNAPLSAARRAELRALGIRQPFVLNVGGACPRKNNEGLIDAYALLPGRLKREYQLVLSFAANSDYREQLQRRASSQGIGEALIMTDFVSDETLRLLYQRCAAFVFPSRYEGFGLPILEALHCGAAVIAGNNSSQIEVVGDAGFLVNVNDPADLADKLARVLQEPQLADGLRQRALVQAEKFSWEQTATRMMTALGGLKTREGVFSTRACHRRVTKRRIAFFSPFPPKSSGISDYSASLLQELKHTYEIDLYHDTGYVPEPALKCREFMSCDARFFPRYAAAKDYHAVLYQMGNSSFHDFMYETMLRFPGIVTLHDFNLTGYQLYRGAIRGRQPEYIREELLRWYPERTEEILNALGPLRWDFNNVVAECGRRGLFFNRHIIEAADRLIVHSPWCLEQVQASSPLDAERIVVVPLGARSREVSLNERVRIRERFGLSPEALLVAAFGILSPEKMVCEALDAFRRVASTNESAVFLCAGQETDNGETRRHAAKLGLTSRVRFLGRQSDKDFRDLIAATDVGVNLRRPPTNGETSAALLNLLAAGVPTLVTDVATFSDYPDTTVRKIRWESEGPAGLRSAMFELASDAQKRERIGRAAREYVSQRHDWSKAARLYVDAIENCHADQAAADPRGGSCSALQSRRHVAAPLAVA